MTDPLPGSAALHARTSVATYRPPAPASPAEPFWSVPIDRLLEEVGSSRDGLSDAEAERRLARLGPNVATPRIHPGVGSLLARQFGSPIVLLLLASAMLSYALGETRDALIVVAIVLASGGLGFWQEHRATGALDALLAMVRTRSAVVREGRRLEIPIEAVVPGDIVLLRAGASIPGDCRVLDARQLLVDESTLTGESLPAEKAPGVSAPDAPVQGRTNVLFLGTHAVGGTGTAVVARTGRHTLFGELSARLARRPAATEFERGVRRFGYLVLEVTLVLVLFIFAVNVGFHRPVLDSLLFTLALAVGLTPQLLPAIVSITLARGAHRMAAEQVLVKRLAAIEDVGSMSVLCTDKTGTITEGSVRVAAAVDVDGAHSASVLLHACLTAHFQRAFDNPIDEVLRAEAGVDLSAWRLLDELPYDFERRRMSVIVTDGVRRLLVTKGAVAEVIAACSGAEYGGERIGIGAARARIDQEFAGLSARGLRCLAVAARPLAAEEALPREEAGLTFLGLLALRDPPKTGVREELAELRALGIEPRLVTGDNRLVAVAIAREVGIPADAVLTGADIRRLGASALAQRAARASVFAEVDPGQKERIIAALRRTGAVVGFLGDGINDAAALRAADVGISVDTAADVTRQAADVVLLRKDLTVLARGVREGRRAFANTLKYIFITTSANFGNMFSMAGASLIASFLPLLPGQILLINFLSDLPAMTIAGDRTDPELVQRPRRWSNALIRSFMISFGLVSSVFDFITFATLLCVLPATVEVFRSGWFVESVVSEILILLVIRTARPFWRSLPSRALMTAAGVVSIATVALPYLPPGRALGFAPMPPLVVTAVLGITIAYVLTSEATKRLLYRRLAL